MLLTTHLAVKFVQIGPSDIYGHLELCYQIAKMQIIKFHCCNYPRMSWITHYGQRRKNVHSMFLVPTSVSFNIFSIYFITYVEIKERDLFSDSSPQRPKIPWYRPCWSLDLQTGWWLLGYTVAGIGEELRLELRCLDMNCGHLK